MEPLDRAPLHFVIGVLIALGAVLLGCYYELNRTEWPAWVQAVVSIGAIGASVWLVNRQHRLERDAHAAGQRVILEGAKQLVSAAEQMVRKTVNALDVGAHGVDDMRKLHVELEGIRSAIQSYPMEIVAAGGYELVEAMTLSHTAMLRCQQVADDVRSAHADHPQETMSIVSSTVATHLEGLGHLAGEMRSRAIKFFPPPAS